MAWVVDLNDSPGVLSRADSSAVNLEDVFRANNGEGHQATELGVLLDCVLIVLLDVVREVVHGDTVVLDVLHDKLLGLGKLSWCKGIGLADDRDDVAARGEALHQLNVKLAETRCCEQGDAASGVELLTRGPLV